MTTGALYHHFDSKEALGTANAMLGAQLLFKPADGNDHIKRLTRSDFSCQQSSPTRHAGLHNRRVTAPYHRRGSTRRNCLGVKRWLRSDGDETGVR